MWFFGLSISLGFCNGLGFSTCLGFSKTLLTGFWLLVLLFNVCNSNFNSFNCSSNLLSTLGPELEVVGFDFSCSFLYSFIGLFKGSPLLFALFLFLDL